MPDFETIPEDSDIFDGCDFGFCALGTTKKQAGSEVPDGNMLPFPFLISLPLTPPFLGTICEN